MRNGDARHGGAANVVVRDQERRRDLAHDADLVAHAHQIGLRRRLDLADHLEGGSRRHRSRLPAH